MPGWRPAVHTGIHLGPDAVYAVGLTRRRGRLSLTHCSAIALDEAPRLPEALADREGRRPLARALRQLRTLGLPRGRPCLSLTGPAAFVRRRPIVPRSKSGSRDHLRWEAEQLLGEDLKEYVVDFRTTRRNGFVVAARREIRERWTALCRESGLGDPRFEMTCFALCKALKAGGAASGQGAELVVHGEAGGTRAVLLRDGDYQVEREWPRDGRDGDGLAGSLARMCEVEPGVGSRVPAVWLSGPEGPALAEGLDGLAEMVGALDPFEGLTRSPAASRGLSTSELPSCAFAVAAGLAYCSTEEV